MSSTDDSDNSSDPSSNEILEEMMAVLGGHGANEDSLGTGLCGFFKQHDPKPKKNDEPAIPCPCAGVDLEPKKTSGAKSTPCNTGKKRKISGKKKKNSKKNCRSFAAKKPKKNKQKSRSCGRAKGSKLKKKKSTNDGCGGCCGGVLRKGGSSQKTGGCA